MGKKWIEEDIEYHKKMVKHYEDSVEDYKRLVIAYPDVESMEPTLKIMMAALKNSRDALANSQRLYKERYGAKASAINRGFKVISGGLCENAQH